MSRTVGGGGNFNNVIYNFVEGHIVYLIIHGRSNVSTRVVGLAVF